MKKMILLIVCLSCKAWAGPCTYADATVEFVGSTWNLTPATFYAKEGDRICVKFSTTDNNKSLVIQNTPLFLHAYPNKAPSEGLMIVRKTGTYTVTCNGCSKKSQIIVQTTREFDAYQKRLDRLNSLYQRNPHYLGQ